MAWRALGLDSVKASVCKCSLHFYTVPPPRSTAGGHCHCQGHAANSPHHFCPSLNDRHCQRFPVPLTPMALVHRPNIDNKVLLPQQNTHGSKTPSRPSLHPGRGVKPCSSHSLPQWHLHRNQRQGPFTQQMLIEYL